MEICIEIMIYLRDTKDFHFTLSKSTIIPSMRSKCSTFFYNHNDRRISFLVNVFLINIKEKIYDEICFFYTYSKNNKVQRGYNV